MILDPINAQDFARLRQRPHRSAAACQWAQLLRFFLLVSVGLGLLALSLNSSRVLSAAAEIERSSIRV